MKRLLPLNWSSIVDYFLRRKTPGRILLDHFMEAYIPKLTGNVIELGSAGLGRSTLALLTESYQLSNLYPREGMLQLDMLDLDLEDDSLDGIVSEVMLEHVPDPFLALRETHRVLKPGGTFVLVVPWMYPFHGAPDDYFRFSKSSIDTMLSDQFELHHVERIGSMWSTLAQFMQLKIWPWSGNYAGTRKLKRTLIGLPLLLIGFSLYIIANFRDHEDDFAMLYGVVATKKYKQTKDEPPPNPTDSIASVS